MVKDDIMSGKKNNIQAIINIFSEITFDKYEDPIRQSKSMIKATIDIEKLYFRRGRLNIIYLL